MLVYTERLIIRNLQQSDLDDLIRLYNDYHFYGYATGIRKSISRKEWLSRYYSNTHDGVTFFSVAREREKGDFVGGMKGYIKETEQNSLWISLLMVDKKFIRQGYGREICMNIIEHFQKNKIVENIYLSVDERNEGACKFWECIGFQQCWKIINHNEVHNETETILIYEKAKNKCPVLEKKTGHL